MTSYQDGEKFVKDPDKYYADVFGGTLEFDDVQEYETWLKQN